MKLAIITCHYNWFGFESPRRNLQQFLSATAELPVYGVEAQLPGHVMQTTGLPGWQQVIADERQVMMQKEALLNLAAASVPAEYNALVWVDADILFTNPDWFRHTAKMLDAVPVVQPYSVAVWQDRNGQPVDQRQSIASAPDRLLRCQAHPGFAMAARRSLWAPKIGGLYDRMVVGNGDVGFAAAALGQNLPGHLRMSEAMHLHYHGWAEGVKLWAKGRHPGVVSGQACHLWHGDLKDRHYMDRNGSLCQVDPTVHLRLAENGLMTWTDAAPFGLRYSVRSHFANRREDG